MIEQVTELQAAIGQLKSDYETLKTQNVSIIQALKDKADAGGATAEELQTIIDSVNTVDAEVKSDIAAGVGDKPGSGDAQPSMQAPTATAQ